MKRLFLFFIPMFFLFACNFSSNSHKNRSTSETQQVNQPKSCYAFNNGKDKVQLSIELNKNQAKGKLEYHYFEKDKNTGSFIGEMHADTLWADYTFISEGIESRREIAFLKRGETMVEGYGEVIEEGGRFVFRDRSSLSFDDSFILVETSCSQNQINY